MNNTQIQDPSVIGTQGLKGLQAGTDYLNPLVTTRWDLSDPLVSQEYVSILEQSQETYGGPRPLAIPDDFGESKYDKRVKHLSDIANLNEFRANEQSSIAKIGAGVAKGAVLAATTFADGIIGSLAGVFNIVSEAAQGNVKSVSDALNAFVSNPFSQAMNSINEWSEQALPNYYTYAENNGPWYSNIFTANFLGDKFLKNLGFMIGAAYSGKVTAGAMSKAMGLSKVRNAFKGAVTTQSGKVLTDPTAILKAYESGDAFMDGVKLTEDLAKAAKKLKNAEFTLKTVGSVTAAMGEGRIEAISNSEMWAKGLEQKAADDLAYGKETIKYDLQREHPEWFAFVRNPDGYGMSVQLVNPAGIAEYEKRVGVLQTKYERTLAKIAEEKAYMANQIFLANTAFLTVSNNLTLGRFFAGGYTKGRHFTNLVKKQGDDFIANNTPLAMKRVRAFSTPFVEANEEMGQAMISETTGIKHGAEVNSFYGKMLQENATSDLTNWYNAISEGFHNTYGNLDRWEEGFIGFITGSLGMPQFSIVTKESGKKGLSFSMSGELWDGLKDVSEMRKQQEEILAAINPAIQNKEFLNKFQSLVRHNVIQSEKDNALQTGDKVAYKNAEVEEIVNLAIMYDQAGAMQDLFDEIESAENFTEDDITAIREAMNQKGATQTQADNKSDEEILDELKHEASQVKKTIDKYLEVSSNLKTLYGENIDRDLLNELTATLVHIDDHETRFTDIFEKVKKRFKESQSAYNSRRVGINATRQNFVNIDELNAEDLLQFGREDGNKILQANKEYFDKHQIKDPTYVETLQDYADLFTLFNQRLDFIEKYNALSQNPELFTKANKELRDRLHQEHLDKIDNLFLEGFNDVQDIESFRTKLKGLKPEIIDRLLEKMESGSNDTLKGLAKQYKKYDKNVDELFNLVNSLQLSGATQQQIFQAINNNPNDFDAVLNSLKALLEDDSTAQPIKDDLQKLLDSFEQEETVKPNKRKKSSTKQKKNDQEPADKKQKMAGGLGIDDDALDDNNEDTDEDEDTNDLMSKLEKCTTLAEATALLNSISDISATDKKRLLNVVKRRLGARPIVNDQRGQQAQTDAEQKNDTATVKQILKSWIDTLYDYIQLKKDKTLKRYTPTDQNRLKVQELLIETGAYDFVDSGALGDRLLQNSKTPIYLVKAPTSKAPKFYTFLAVPNDPKQPISTDNLQIVGVVGYNTDHEDKYDTLNKYIEGKFTTKKNDWVFIEDNGQKVFTTVSHVYSGRMATKDTQETLTLDYLQSGRSALALRIESGWRSVVTDNIVDLNINNPTNRNGSIWLLTKGADGLWYPKYVEIKSTQEWYNEHKDDDSNHLISQLKEAIEALKSSNEYEQMTGKIAIKSIFNFGSEQDISFNSDEGVVQIFVKNIGIVKAFDENSSTEDILQAIIDMNLRLQVSTVDIQDANEVKKLVEAGIFKTDIQLVADKDGNPHPSNVNSSFDINPLDEEGNIIELEQEQTGHTGTRGINKSKPQYTFTMQTGNKSVTYSKDSEGNWFKMDGKEKVAVPNLDEWQDFLLDDSVTVKKSSNGQWFKKIGNGRVAHISEQEAQRIKQAKQKAAQKKQQLASQREMLDTLNEEDGVTGVILEDQQDDENGATLDKLFKPSKQSSQEQGFPTSSSKLQKPKKATKKAVSAAHKQEVEEQKKQPKVIAQPEVESQPTSEQPTTKANHFQTRAAKRMAEMQGKPKVERLSNQQIDDYLISLEGKVSTLNPEGLPNSVEVSILLTKMQDAGMDISTITSIETLQQQLETFQKCHGGKLFTYDPF